ncbi:MAG: sodium:proton antiporter [Solirubrobacteraceae bacterium]|nr:sodium:proton antiporter [Solirubrobacteraceae bacterium]
MTSILTRYVARALLAPVLIVSVGILVKGYADVGDGFAAGVVAALALLLQYVAFGTDAVEHALPIRWAPGIAIAGLAIAVLVFAVPMAFGEPPLEHAPPAGEEPVHLGSLELITAVVFDVGVFLLVIGAVGTIIGSLVDPDREAP